MHRLSHESHYSRLLISLLRCHGLAQEVDRPQGGLRKMERNTRDGVFVALSIGSLIHTICLPITEARSEAPGFGNGQQTGRAPRCVKME